MNFYNAGLLLCKEASDTKDYLENWPVSTINQKLKLLYIFRAVLLVMAVGLWVAPRRSYNSQARYT